jgi:hypothetical protein
MKSLFATLVLVGVATCTITTERLRGEEIPIVSRKVASTSSYPFIEKVKYRENVLGRDIEEEEEEGILGKSTHGDVYTRTSKNPLEKLLKHKVPEEIEIERERAVLGKKHHMRGGDVLLSRDKKYKSVGDEDIFGEEEEELFRIMDKEDVPVHKRKDVEEKLRKRTKPLLKSHREDVGIIGGETHKRGILNPHKEYVLEKKEMMTPLTKKTFGRERIGEESGLSYNVNIDEKKIEDFVEEL